MLVVMTLGRVRHPQKKKNMGQICITEKPRPTVCVCMYINTVIWSVAVRYLIYLARESPISVFCQINQILGKQLSKQLFYYSHPGR